MMSFLPLDLDDMSDDMSRGEVMFSDDDALQPSKPTGAKLRAHEVVHAYHSSDDDDADDPGAPTGERVLVAWGASSRGRLGSSMRARAHDPAPSQEAQLEDWDGDDVPIDQLGMGQDMLIAEWDAAEATDVGVGSEDGAACEPEVSPKCGVTRPEQAGLAEQHIQDPVSGSGGAAPGGQTGTAGNESSGGASPARVSGDQQVPSFAGDSEGSASDRSISVGGSGGSVDESASVGDGCGDAVEPATADAGRDCEVRGGHAEHQYVMNSDAWQRVFALAAGQPEEQEEAHGEAGQGEVMAPAEEGGDVTVGQAGDEAPPLEGPDGLDRLAGAAQALEGEEQQADEGDDGALGKRKRRQADAESAGDDAADGDGESEGGGSAAEASMQAELQKLATEVAAERAAVQKVKKKKKKLRRDKPVVGREVVGGEQRGAGSPGGEEHSNGCVPGVQEHAAPVGLCEVTASHNERMFHHSCFPWTACHVER